MNELVPAVEAIKAELETRGRRLISLKYGAELGYYEFKVTDSGGVPFTLFLREEMLATTPDPGDLARTLKKVAR